MSNDTKINLGPDSQSGAPAPELPQSDIAPPVQQAPPRVRIQLPGERTIVTYGVMAFTVLVFIGQMLGNSLLGGDILAAYGMKINFYIERGQLWRLFTAVFLHGGLTHIAFNMYALHILGRELERFYGSARFLILYMVGAFAGNVFSFMFTDANSLGASTAIFALLGGYAVFVFRNREVFGGNTQRVLRNIGQVLLINLIIGLTPGIDNWGHLGGLIGGVALAWIGGIDFTLGGDSLSGLKLEEKNSPQRFVLGAAVVLISFGSLVVIKGMIF